MNPSVPLIPDTAPFSSEQRAWLNGFLAGVFSRTPAVDGVPSHREATPALQPLTILFGSQTGTAEGLAKKVAKAAGKRGFAATVLDMAQADLARLAGERNLLAITSTYGDGEPPDNAKALHTALKVAASASEPARPLADLRFSVCALGDTNYVQFCQCGKDLDAWFEKLGATRVSPRTDCDLDYDAKFTAWLDAALGSLSSNVGGSLPPDSSATSGHKAPPTTETEPTYSKQNPFPAPILAVDKLNAPGSAKEVNHVEFSLEGSGLVYEAGDALGVLPQNCPDLVTELLTALGCDGEEAVPVPDGGTTSLRHALTTCYDLARPTAEFIARYGAPAPGAGGGTATATAVQHIIDIVLARPETRLAPAEFVGLLRKLQPRLYSIASSPKAHPGQVHLTVGAVRYEAHGRARKGVCSTFLADRIPVGSTTKVFVHSNKAFRPPASSDAPMIMVGPGTGIAPFRAFLEERQTTGAKGKNWLFFGDQRAATDFLYRDELLAMQTAGVLTRLDLAFSRDQAEKIYVQQRMLENAAELFAWLEAGAHFYVCGDASRMAKDVDAALYRVIETAGGKSPADAAAYVQAMKAAKRYARDVY